MSRDSKGQTPTLPTLPSQSGVFDALWRDVFDRIDTLDSDITSTMGTVTGRSGGAVLVHIDGERLPRTIGFARKKGVRYSTNDRVSLKRTRGGDWIVDGVVTDSSSEVAVYGEQIATDAVAYRQIAFGQVFEEHLEPGLRNKINSTGSLPANSVGSSQIQSSAVGSDELKADAVDWQHLHKTGRGSLGSDVENLVNFAKNKGWI